MRASAESETGRGGASRLPDEFRNSWWLLKRRGLLAAAAGGIVFLHPAQEPVTAVALLVIYSATDGVLATGACARAARVNGSRYFLAAEAVAGLSALLVAGLWPEVPLTVLMWIQAAWAAATAASALAAASHFREYLTREWFLACGGVVMMRFGAFVIGAACCGAAAPVIWACGTSLVFALLLAALGIRLMNRTNHYARPGPQPIA